MLGRFLPLPTTSEPGRLPERRWLIRAPQVYLWGLLGAVLFSVAPFVFWWRNGSPLWLLEVTMLIGWFVAMPRPLYLALDDRGIAIVHEGWLGRKYLWIPRDRLVRLEIKQGWLLATGTDVEQQGELGWVEAARQAGASPPGWLNLFVQSPGMAPFQIAAPIHLIDRMARGEIELWMYQQGK